MGCLNKFEIDKFARILIEFGIKAGYCTKMHKGIEPGHY